MHTLPLLYKIFIVLLPPLFHNRYIINNQVASGIYDKISSVVEREKMLGRLSGISDLEAYKTVGDAMEAQGLFNPTETKPVESIIEKPAEVVVSDEERNIQRKLAGATSTKTTSTDSTVNHLAMSDEEFMALASFKNL